MNILEYVPLALRTEKPLPTEDRIVHGCMGLITEIGEVTTELKRMAIYEKPLDEERRLHILEEIGDVLWYVAIIAHATEIDKVYLLNATYTIIPILKTNTYQSAALLLSQKCGVICKLTGRVKAGVPKKANFLQKITQNLSSIVVALSILAKECGSNLDVVMYDNIAKLRIRYPDKYTNEAAEGRADKVS